MFFNRLYIHVTAPLNFPCTSGLAQDPGPIQSLGVKYTDLTHKPSGPSNFHQLGIGDTLNMDGQGMDKKNLDTNPLQFNIPG